MMHNIKYLKATILTFFLLFVSLPLHAKDVIKFVYFDQFEPFSWKQDGNMRGIFIDVVNEVFDRRLNFDVIHEGYPWQRAQRLVRTGKADGMCTISSKERLSYALPIVQPIIKTEFKIFTGRSSKRLHDLTKVQSISELKGFALIDILGSGWAKAHLGEMDVRYERTYARIFMLLEKGRYDAAIRNDTQTNYLINKFGFKGNVIELPQPMTATPQEYRILISKKSTYAKYQQEINSILEKMTRDKTLLLIRNKHLN